MRAFLTLRLIMLALCVYRALPIPFPEMASLTGNLQFQGETARPLSKYWLSRMTQATQKILLSEYLYNIVYEIRKVPCGRLPLGQDAPDAPTLAHFETTGPTVGVVVFILDLSPPSGSRPVASRPVRLRSSAAQAGAGSGFGPSAAPDRGWPNASLTGTPIH